MAFLTYLHVYVDYVNGGCGPVCLHVWLLVIEATCI